MLNVVNASSMRNYLSNGCRFDVLNDVDSIAPFLGARKAEIKSFHTYLSYRIPLGECSPRDARRVYIDSLPHTAPLPLRLPLHLRGGREIPSRQRVSKLCWSTLAEGISH